MPRRIIDVLRRELGGTWRFRDRLWLHHESYAGYARLECLSAPQSADDTVTCYYELLGLGSGLDRGLARRSPISLARAPASLRPRTTQFVWNPEGLRLFAERLRELEVLYGDR